MGECAGAESKEMASVPSGIPDSHGLAIPGTVTEASYAWDSAGSTARSINFRHFRKFCEIAAREPARE